jgi:hypothetical protein
MCCVPLHAICGWGQKVGLLSQRYGAGQHLQHLSLQTRLPSSLVFACPPAPARIQPAAANPATPTPVLYCFAPAPPSCILLRAPVGLAPATRCATPAAPSPPSPHPKYRLRPARLPPPRNGRRENSAPGSGNRPWRARNSAPRSGGCACRERGGRRSEVGGEGGVSWDE